MVNFFDLSQKFFLGYLIVYFIIKLTILKKLIYLNFKKNYTNIKKS